jgi:hypothetical protein
MTHKIQSLGAAMAAILLVVAGTAQAAIIHESATLGPTGYSLPSFSISATHFIGSRFSLTKPVEVAAVGGHLVRFEPSGSVFATITALSGPAGFPISGTAGLPSVDATADWTPLATTLVDVPTMSSIDVLVPLPVTLNPGHYGLVFGTRVFGANAEGGMPPNNHDLPGRASYFHWSAFDVGWSDTSVVKNVRFVVTGRVIPEPVTRVLAGSAVAYLSAIARRGGPRRRISAIREA